VDKPWFWNFVFGDSMPTSFEKLNFRFGPWEKSPVIPPPFTFMWSKIFLTGFQYPPKWISK
jgi:hypothetical protein